MTEGLGDFFKLIAEDKKRKKEEFKELVGEIDINSIFSEVKEEIKKDKVNSVKAEKQVAAFESWLFSETEEEKEEIVVEVAEEFREEVETVEPEPEEEIVEEVEEETTISKSIKVLDTIKEQEDPLNDTQFATFDDLKKHYQLFLDRISVQLSSLGGGGIEDAPKTGGPYVRQGQKWVVSSGGGGVGAGGTWAVDTVGINTTKSVGIGTTAKDGYSLYVQGDARITGILTVGESSVTIDGREDKIIIGTGTTITSGGNAEFVGVITASGIHLDDDDKLTFGDGNDLEIFHNSSNNNTIIQENGPGNLVIKGTNLFLQSLSNENFFKGDADGAVELYYDNSKKFETTGYGVTVTGISSAQNVSIANTFTYPEYITGGTVPRAIKSQGGYDRTDGFADRQTATNASQDPADYIEYTQEYADSGTWLRFGITTAANQANDNQWWGETNPNYDNTKGLFGGLTNPAGVDDFFVFSENTSFNNAQTTGSLKYTQALGSFSLKECQVGDLVLARFDLNVMPMVTNTTIEVGLIYANRDDSDTVTFTFPLTTTPFTYGSGTVGRGYLIRPTVTAYMANQQDVNSRSLLAIKADNPVLVNPIGVLFTIQR